MDVVAIGRRVFQIEQEQLRFVAQSLGDSFERAIELILDTTGKVIVIGVGKSGLVGSKIAATFASTGTPSFFLHPTEAMHGDLGMVGRDDLVLAISYSGESEELVAILPHLKRIGVPIIAMCSRMESSLAGYSDIPLSIAITQEACPLNAAPTSSTTVTMALGDALAVALMEKRNFQKEDFASLHPGGSLGKRLFLKVKNLMRTENLPIVSRETSLHESIVVMTKGRLGNLIVLDDDRRVAAVLSDGDLRRALMRDDFSLNDPVIEYANRHPMSVSDPEMLASDALVLIEEKKIQILLVVSEEGHLQGLMHLHDLVEAGIKT